MPGDRYPAGGLPRLTRVDVVAGTLLERLRVGALHHEYVEVDPGDLQDGSRVSRHPDRIRGPVGGDPRPQLLLEVGAHLSLEALRGESGSPQLPRNVTADGQASGDEQDGQDSKGQGDTPASPPRGR